MRSSATTSTSAPRGTLSWMVAATPSAGVPKRSPLRWTSCTPAGQSRAPLFLMRQILSSWAPGATCSPSGTVTSSKNWELKSIRGSWLVARGSWVECGGGARDRRLLSNEWHRHSMLDSINLLSNEWHRLYSTLSDCMDCIGIECTLIDESCSPHGWSPGRGGCATNTPWPRRGAAVVAVRSSRLRRQCTCSRSRYSPPRSTAVSCASRFPGAEVRQHHRASVQSVAQ